MHWFLVLTIVLRHLADSTQIESNRTYCIPVSNCDEDFVYGINMDLPAMTGGCLIESDNQTQACKLCCPYEITAHTTGSPQEEFGGLDEIPYLTEEREDGDFAFRDVNETTISEENKQMGNFTEQSNGKNTEGENVFNTYAGEQTRYVEHNMDDFTSYEDSREEDYEDMYERRKRSFEVACGYSVTQNRIFGGKDVPFGKYPWMVSLAYRKRVPLHIVYHCGATLVHKRYVVTAAHCVVEFPHKELFFLRLGSRNLRVEEECSNSKIAGTICYPRPFYVYPKRVIIHPLFNKTDSFYGNDIALIEMDGEVDFERFTHVRPICLPNNPSQIKDPLYVAGFGYKDMKGKISHILQDLQVPYNRIDYCQSLYPEKNLTESQLCLGGNKGEDSCNADSGGPVMHLSSESSKAGGPYYLTGIVSYGMEECGMANRPAIYTSVWHYLDWIKENIQD